MQGKRHRINLNGSRSPWEAFKKQFRGRYPENWATWIQKKEGLAPVTRRDHPDVTQAFADIAQTMGLGFVPKLFTTRGRGRKDDTGFMQDWLPHIVISRDELRAASRDPAFLEHVEYSFSHEMQHGYQPDFFTLTSDIWIKSGFSPRKADKLLKEELDKLGDKISAYLKEQISLAAHEIFVHPTLSFDFLYNAKYAGICQAEEHDADLAYAEHVGDAEAAMLQIVITRVLLTDKKDPAKIIEEIISGGGDTKHPSDLERILVLAREGWQKNHDNAGVKDQESARNWVRRVVTEDSLVRNLIRK